MSAYETIARAMDSLGGQRLNPTMCKAPFPVGDAHQDVFLGREMLQPDAWFLKVTVPIGAASAIDIPSLAHRFGDLTVASLVYSPGETSVIILTANVPEVVVGYEDLPSSFMYWMARIAGAGLNIRRELGLVQQHNP